MLLAVITHQHDQRLPGYIPDLFKRTKPIYQLDAVLRAARWRGLRWFMTDPGRPFRAADAALLHVNTTVTPASYQELAGRYPKVVNGAVTDISKRHVSRILVTRDDDWQGPVMVKSNLNCRGEPERFLARSAARSGNHPLPKMPLPDYRVFDRKALVPLAVWSDEALVVERLLLEKRGDHNVLRVWNFMGDYERCNWYSSPEVVIKGRNIREFGPSPVPDEIRAERQRLGFDYGKFDFAITPDGPVLFDANRTPAFLHSRPDLMRAEAPGMARGLIGLIRS